MSRGPQAIADAATGTSGLRLVFLAQRPLLLRLLTARLQSAEDAEDVLQELWIKLAREAPGPIGQPQAYLFRIANNLALDHRRSAQRRTVRESGWHEVQPTSAEYGDAEAGLITRERLATLQAAIAALPDRAREAFCLYRFDGLRRGEVAARMGISVSAVEKLLHRAYRHVHAADDGAGEREGEDVANADRRRPMRMEVPRDDG